MCLQKQDYEKAWKLQQELKKRCPNDKVIKEFDDFLPAEVKAQRGDKPSSDEYYDEEEDQEKAEKDDYEAEDYDVEVTSQEQREFQEELKKEEQEMDEKNKKNREEFGDPGSGYEWDSNIDSEGNPIVEEEEEEEWYYNEDEEAHKRGESTIPEILNKNQVGLKQNQFLEDRARVGMLVNAGKTIGKDTGAKFKLKKKPKRVGGGHLV